MALAVHGVVVSEIFLYFSKQIVIKETSSTKEENNKRFQPSKANEEYQTRDAKHEKRICFEFYQYQIFK